MAEFNGEISTLAQQYTELPDLAQKIAEKWIFHGIGELIHFLSADFSIFEHGISISWVQNFIFWVQNSRLCVFTALLRFLHAKITFSEHIISIFKHRNSIFFVQNLHFLIEEF